MSEPETQFFDLNIGEILDAWMPRHAVREFIANALDEQTLTGTPDVVITESSQGWLIRDRGRGLRFEHLRQSEDAEKLKNSTKVIGRFGFGLKDALATLHRRGVRVEIRSAHGDISVIERPKHGFDSIPTLHAAIRAASDPNRVGTEVLLRGLAATEMMAAKAFFLRFSGEETLGHSPFGEILRRQSGQPGRVYVKGLLVAEEAAFAFSYNVTSLTATMEKALNRERTNVGRTAYSDRVKAMLLACEAPSVSEILAVEIGKLERGTAHDEVKWTDVAVHACKILNVAKKVVFVSAKELEQLRSMVDHAREDGYELVILPDSIRAKLNGLRDNSDGAVRSLDVFTRLWVAGFTFDFVPESHLKDTERALFAQRDRIAALAGGWPDGVREVLVSNTMRPNEDGSGEACGLWQPEENRIIIKRDQLTSPKRFAGTLLHEVAHARSGAPDVSTDFEEALTDVIGDVVSKALASATTASSTRAVRQVARPKTSRTRATPSAGPSRRGARRKERDGKRKKPGRR